MKKLCEKVVEVRKVGDEVMTAVVGYDEDVLRLICGYAPQIGKCFVFYGELKCD